MTKFSALILASITWFVIGADNAAADDPNLQFTQISSKTDIWNVTNAGDGSNRLFLVGGPGLVYIIDGGQELSTPFLDIQNIVNFDGLLMGLFDVEFAPDYESSGVFYACFSDSQEDIVMARFRVSDDPNIANPGSRENIIVAAMNLAENTLCQLQFGPDGMLYMSVGDDGGGYSQDNAQDGSNFLGKILRIDVDPMHGTYAIPPDNPFVADTGVRDEIWALGLRDPIIGFDKGTGDLYISDYGPSTAEINFQSTRSSGGKNYGWNVMEGRSCVAGGCNMDGLTVPVTQYGLNGSCLVIGGDVYRGLAYPNLEGTYFYGDFCSGLIWGLSRDGDEWVSQVLANTNFGVAGFGSGEDGSLYVVAWENGVYLISDGPSQAEPGFSINAGFNDAWYYGPTAGQGFLIAVWEQIETMFVAWFTYDVERPAEGTEAILGDPGHRWITAQGSFSGATANLIVYNSTGGVFDSSEPVVGPPDTIGTMTITWTDCNTGVISYNIPTLGLFGNVPITRIVTENAALCQALQ